MTVPEQILQELQQIKYLVESHDFEVDYANKQEDGIRAYDVKKVSELLSVSPSTIRRHAQAGKLPCFKIGDRYMFPVKKLNRWVDDKVEENENYIEVLAGEI